MDLARRSFVCLGLVASAAVPASIGCGGSSDSGLLGPAEDASASDATVGGGDGSPTTDGAPGNDGAASCTPGPIGTPAWKPPTGYPRDACTTSQITTILDDCYGAHFDKAKCDGDRTSIADCFKCMVTDESAAALGPLIHLGDYASVNFPGCVAIEQGARGASSCAGLEGIALDCQMLACASPCSGLDAGGPSKVNAYNACLDAVIASGQPCASYQQAISCPASDPAYATCYANGDKFAPYAARVAAVFCTGGAPIDAGPDATGDDAGATDASLDAPDGD